MADLMMINSIGLILGPLIGGVLGEISKLLINPNGIFFSSALSLPGYAAAGITVVAISLTFAVLKETMTKERRVELKRREEELKKLQQPKSKLFTKEFVLRLFELFCQSMGTMMIFSSMSLILLDRYLLSEGYIGAIYAIIGVEMMLISSYGIRFLLKKFNDTKLLIFFTLMMVFVFLTFPFLYTVWLMIVFIGPLILSMAILRPILIANTQKAAPPDRQGVASGWRVNTYAIASVIAPLVSTAFLDLQIGELYFLGVKIAYYFMALASSFMLLIMFYLVKYDIRNFSRSFRNRPSVEEVPSKFKKSSEENQF
jgi:predicted MFS family arabinose efflux permease